MAGRNHDKSRAAARPGEEWIADRFSLPAYVCEDTTYRPDVVMWLSRDGILSSQLCPPDAPADIVGEELEKAMTAPMVGRPRRPARIRVQDPALVAPIRSVVGPAMEIEVAPIPEMDEVREGLAVAMSASPDAGDRDARYADSIPAALLCGFHKAAARLYRAAPWRVVPSDAHVMALSAPALGVEQACLAVIGQMGESYGVLLFDSIDAYDAFGQAGATADEGEKAPRDIGAAVFAVGYERGADVPAGVRQQIMREGWEVAAPEAYPTISWTDPDLVVRPVTSRDVVLAWTCVEAVHRFITAHREELSEGFGDALTERYQLDEVPGAGEVTIVAPHPDAGDRWATEDDDEAMREAEEMVDEFVDEKEVEGRDEVWLQQALFVCDQLCRFKLEHHDGDLSRWTADAVETFLMSHFPRNVGGDDALIERVPDVLRAFFRWQAERGSLSGRSATAIEKRIEARRKPFVRAARDPRNFGIAKTLMRMMEDRGVDLSDEGAVRKFIDQCNDPHTGLLPFPGLFDQVRPTRGAARRAPPAPHAPCPCGSGRPFSRCCMPR